MVTLGQDGKGQRAVALASGTSRMRRFAPLLVVVAFASCARASSESERAASSSTSAAPMAVTSATPSELPLPLAWSSVAPPAPRWKTTAELVHEPKLRDAVDALASGRADAFEKVRAIAGPRDLARLLEHESAFVRVSAADHIAAVVPSEMGQLAPLLRDDSPVAWAGHAPVPVSTVVLEALCKSRSREAGLLLLGLMREPRSFARDPLGCAVDIVPDDAAAFAEKAPLRDAARREGSRADALGPRGRAARFGVQDHPQGGCGRVSRRARGGGIGARPLRRRREHESPRALVARQGSRRHPRGAREHRLESVRGEGTSGRAHRRSRRLERRVSSAPAHPPIIGRDAGARSRLEGAPPEMARSDDGTRSRASPSRQRSRRWWRELAAEAPTVGEFEWSPRKAAVQYLSAVRDRESLPLFRASLASADAYEVRASLKVIGELKDVTARAEVVKLTSSPSTETAALADEDARVARCAVAEVVAIRSSESGRRSRADLS